jgi:hypothetical protein
VQLHSASTFPPRPSPKEAIPYTSAALRQDLQPVRGVWEDHQADRDRNAIYAYLTAVYGLVAWRSAEGRETERACRALRLQRLKVSDRDVRRRHPVHRRPGQGGQTDQEQVVASDALRHRVQAECRGPGPVH